jgi:uncharacterized protein YkuJ
LSTDFLSQFQETERINNIKRKQVKTKSPNKMSHSNMNASNMAEVKGTNVVKVSYSNGSFVMTSPAAWEEFDAAGTSLFSFREDRRDGWSVFLTDSNRKVHLQLDLHTKVIYYSDANTPRREQYGINEAYNMPDANGTNVVEVSYSNGSFVMTSPAAWEEFDAAGTSLFSFREDRDRRDGWSVFLTDPNRQVHLQLDLHTKIIYYSDANTARREQYGINGAYSLGYSLG